MPRTVTAGWEPQRKVEIVKHAMVNINNQKECEAKMPQLSVMLKIELWHGGGGRMFAGHDRP